jgi:putative endonuclease
MNGKDLGRLGENLAEKFLQSKGYDIVTKNFRYKQGEEIDIIALKGELVVFVEVKAIWDSQEEKLDDPIYNVTPSKVNKIHRAGRLFLIVQEWEDRDYAIEVVSMVIDRYSKKARVRHYTDITG